MPREGGRLGSIRWKKLPLRLTSLFQSGGQLSLSISSLMNATCTAPNQGFLLRSCRNRSALRTCWISQAGLARQWSSISVAIPMGKDEKTHCTSEAGDYQIRLQHHHVLSNDDDQAIGELPQRIGSKDMCKHLWFPSG